MPSNLVIVESPAKAKTISKYLGKDFEVLSSFGHIRDLPKSKIGVDTDGDFDPQYIIPKDKQKTVTALKKAAKGSTVWLASDEDREGEAIAWHLAEALDLDPKTTNRIVFHEITEPALKKAVESPRTIDMNLVDAQQARRVLDRLVGYKVSPVLWKKIRRGLSAGRVQSVALRLIVEREKLIKEHKAESEFTLNFKFKLTSGSTVEAKLDKKLKSHDDAKNTLISFATGPCVVSKVSSRTTTRKPAAPLTTSSLQQDASSRLGFSVKRTMQLAQRLYEAGHITYMRTDSLNISDQAMASMKQEIIKGYGNNYYKSRKFTAKSKGAQEAHEAIRPTNFSTRSAGKDPAQSKLYDLIYSRTLATQMSDARITTNTLTIDCSSNHKAVAESQSIEFDGFLKVIASAYKSQDFSSASEGDKVSLDHGIAEEGLTKPTPRYTEASLVKDLEKRGIGRPSTYAPTISTVMSRGYVIKGEGKTQTTDLTTMHIDSTAKLTEQSEAKNHSSDKGKLVPTEIGTLVSDYLVEEFPNIVDYDFTAEIEDKFDGIADGKSKWKQFIGQFYGDFIPTVEKAEKSEGKLKGSEIDLGKHPETGEPVVVRFARFGPVFQIGKLEKDGPKPKFVPLPPGTDMEQATMEDLKSMEVLPRIVGQLDSGDEVLANFGPYGPYVKIGKRFVSIGETDPRFVTIDQAKEAIAEDDKKPKSGTLNEWGNLKVKNGRFGPYVTNGKTNVKIPKGTDPEKIDEKAAKELIDSKGSSKSKSKSKPRKKRASKK